MASTQTKQKNILVIGPARSGKTYFITAMTHDAMDKGGVLVSGQEYVMPRMAAWRKDQLCEKTQLGVVNQVNIKTETGDFTLCDISGDDYDAGKPYEAPTAPFKFKFENLDGVVCLLDVPRCGEKFLHILHTESEEGELWTNYVRDTLVDQFTRLGSVLHNKVFGDLSNLPFAYVFSKADILPNPERRPTPLDKLVDEFSTPVKDIIKNYGVFETVALPGKTAGFDKVLDYFANQ